VLLEVTQIPPQNRTRMQVSIVRLLRPRILDVTPYD
jgi:hypothetical protein